MVRVKKSDGMFDVVIVGGGYVGLLLVLVLKQGDSMLKCVVVDFKLMVLFNKDLWVLVIVVVVLCMLMQFGVWDKIVVKGQLIMEMIVIDSKLWDVVWLVFLIFDGEVIDGEFFVMMMLNGVMMLVFYKVVKVLGVMFFVLYIVVIYWFVLDYVDFELKDGIVFQIWFLVVVDGVCF